MNIPNVLTGLRFIIVPVMGYYLLQENYLLGVMLFIVGGFTDVLDGYIARKFNMITKWGNIADPLADKLMQITAITILTIQGLIPWIVVALVVGKEILMGLGSLLLYRKENFVVGANWYGKLATVVFYIAIVVMIAIRIMGVKDGIYFYITYSLFFLAILSTLYAFLMYALNYIKIRKKWNLNFK